MSATMKMWEAPVFQGRHLGRKMLLGDTYRLIFQHSLWNCSLGWHWVVRLNELYKRNQDCPINQEIMGNA